MKLAHSAEPETAIDNITNSFKKDLLKRMIQYKIELANLLKSYRGLDVISNHFSFWVLKSFQY